LQRENENRCFFTGRPATDLVHIFRKGTHPQYSEEIAYLILGCRSAHNTFDNGSYEEVMSLSNIGWVLEIMQAGDELYYNRFTEFKKMKSH